MNPNSMLYWWPRTNDLGIPTPRTVMVEFDPPEPAEALMYACVAHPKEEVDPGNSECAIWLDAHDDRIAAAAQGIGFPLFMRTDQVSGKHHWETTCYVPDEDALRSRTWAVIEAHALALWMEGPDGNVAGLALRQFLDLEAPFTAFAGMPVARERRYFVADGEVVCHHPYWEDEENIEGGLSWGSRRAVPPRWREQLAELNAEGLEVPLLTDYAKRVAAVVPGAWSVDFAYARNEKWYLIDMALAERSWHPKHAEAGA